MNESEFLHSMRRDAPDRSCLSSFVNTNISETEGNLRSTTLWVWRKGTESEGQRPKIRKKEIYKKLWGFTLFVGHGVPSAPKADTRAQEEKCKIILSFGADILGHHLYELLCWLYCAFCRSWVHVFLHCFRFNPCLPHILCASYCKRMSRGLIRKETCNCSLREYMGILYGYLAFAAWTSACFWNAWRIRNLLFGYALRGFGGSSRGWVW